MRRLTALLVLLSLLLLPAMAQAEPPIRLLVNGTEVVADSPPVIEGGRTLVPLRALAEALGFAVTWNDAAKAATLTKGDLTIVLTIDKNEALVNGKPVPLDVPPMIRGNRTLIPVRFVATQLGAEINWDENNRVVKVGLPGAKGTPVNPSPDNPAKLPNLPGVDPAAIALLNQVQENKNFRVTGDFTIAVGTPMGEMSIKSAMEIYTKGQDTLTLTSTELFGMTQKTGQAVYKGEVWAQDTTTGVWAKAPKTTAEALKSSDPTRMAELNAKTLEAAKITLTEQAYNGQAMKVVSISWDLLALGKIVGQDTAELSEGQITVAYWFTQSGTMDHMDLQLTTKSKDGTATKMTGSFFYEPWEKPIPFPAAITG